MTTPRTVIVHGPRGCGKTVHRKTIAAIFGIAPNMIEDGETVSDLLGRRLVKGTLYLISEDPLGAIKGSGILVKPYLSLGLPDLRNQEDDGNLPPPIFMRGSSRGKLKIVPPPADFQQRIDERDERMARSKRATARAKALPQPGDRLQVEYGCSNRIINVTMTGWEGCWICCRTYNDIHALHIRKVNGKPVSFADPAPEQGQ